MSNNKIFKEEFIAELLLTGDYTRAEAEEQFNLNLKQDKVLEKLMQDAEEEEEYNDFHEQEWL